MHIENIKEGIRVEMRKIEKEYNTADWDYQDVDKMNSEEAFNRGYYRALESILNDLIKLTK